jgi:glycosyltransferase involved in cell wall biosynthesis
MRPLAIIPVYNESDIIPAVLGHLDQQGCDVYVLDNWSTDLSPEFISRLGSNVERWPAECPATYDWTGILRRVEEIALERGAGRWVILHDADEIRRAPDRWQGFNLAQALRHAQAGGYNAVTFAVKTYAPIDNSWVPAANPEAHFRYWKREHADNQIPHIKAWFQGSERVDLHTHGGHQALFAGRNVCPEPFMLKHYPIRSQAHGERKVLKERFPRYSAAERARQWHVQYDDYVTNPKFVLHPRDLREEPRPVTIVTLTRFPDIFATFAESVERHEPAARRIVVTSGGITIGRPGWEEVPGIEPFVFARNLNLGITEAGTDDVLCVNDDVRFLGPVIGQLSEAAYAATAAIVSPQIVGDGINNRTAQASHALPTDWERTSAYIPFVCVLLRRSALDSIGLLYEGFVGYGGEDVEFGLRAIRQGWSLAVSKCRVKHGHDGHTHSSSFLRVIDDSERNKSAQANAARAELLDYAKAGPPRLEALCSHRSAE